MSIAVERFPVYFKQVGLQSSTVTGSIFAETRSQCIACQNFAKHRTCHLYCMLVFAAWCSKQLIPNVRLQIASYLPGFSTWMPLHWSYIPVSLCRGIIYSTQLYHIVCTPLSCGSPTPLWRRLSGPASPTFRWVWPPILAGRNLIVLPWTAVLVCRCWSLFKTETSNGSEMVPLVCMPASLTRTWLCYTCMTSSVCNCSPVGYVNLMDVCLRPKG